MSVFCYQAQKKTPKKKKVLHSFFWGELITKNKHTRRVKIEHLCSHFYVNRKIEFIGMRRKTDLNWWRWQHRWNNQNKEDTAFLLTYLNTPYLDTNTIHAHAPTHTKWVDQHNTTTKKKHIELKIRSWKRNRKKKSWNTSHAHSVTTPTFVMFKTSCFNTTGFYTMNI